MRAATVFRGRGEEGVGELEISFVAGGEGGRDLFIKFFIVTGGLEG